MARGMGEIGKSRRIRAGNPALPAQILQNFKQGLPTRRIKMRATSSKSNIGTSPVRRRHCAPAIISPTKSPFCSPVEHFAAAMFWPHGSHAGQCGAGLQTRPQRHRARSACRRARQSLQPQSPVAPATPLQRSLKSHLGAGKTFRHCRQAFSQSIQRGQTRRGNRRAEACHIFSPARPASHCRKIACPVFATICCVRAWRALLLMLCRQTGAQRLRKRVDKSAPTTALSVKACPWPVSAITAGSAMDIFQTRGWARRQTTQFTARSAIGKADTDPHWRSGGGDSANTVQPAFGACGRHVIQLRATKARPGASMEIASRILVLPAPLGPVRITRAAINTDIDARMRAKMRQAQSGNMRGDRPRVCQGHRHSGLRHKTHPTPAWASAHRVHGILAIAHDGRGSAV
ncbi:MAG: hypothetical protein CM15mP21_5900 [Hyphomicrobiales bacterium]|nr:MAG: hypothetical protein CM15mP21_5900 [Hyphomicrobiales bacterium]